MKKRAKKGQGVSPPRKRGKNYKLLAARDVVARFSCCGRCSFFLAGYRVAHNEAFDSAVSQIDGGWLTFEWNGDMGELVSKSYGCRLDIDCYYLEGCCKECKRRFVYDADPDEERPPVFRIRV